MKHEPADTVYSFTYMKHKFTEINCSHTNLPHLTMQQTFHFFSIPYSII